MNQLLDRFPKLSIVSCWLGALGAKLAEYKTQTPLESAKAIFDLLYVVLGCVFLILGILISIRKLRQPVEKKIKK